MKEFQKGTIIKTAAGEDIEIIEKIGEGGQGIVYRVKYRGKGYALKWYFKTKLKDKDAFYKNLQDNIIRQGAPTGAFLWPIAITERAYGSFGYIMELRPENYIDFSLFLLAKVRFSGVSAAINAALCIIKGFRALHNRGYSYQDLNDSNFFADPETGDVLICDNDNVAPNGSNLGIAGKCRYMAPEVVTGDKMPDTHTDRFSLSVILYMLLFLNHPLEGKRTMAPCLTEELERRFYGTDPLFVWDEEDASNRPVRGVHTNEMRIWPVFPQFVRDAFTRAFSREALLGPDADRIRIQEKEWQEIFTELRGITVKCGCGGEAFIDTESPYSLCADCGRDISRPPVLKVKKYNVAMQPGAKVYACHTDADSDDFAAEEGEVISGRNAPGMIGLRNGSERVWTVTLPNGRSLQYEKGKVIKIVKDINIDFGNGNKGVVY